MSAALEWVDADRVDRALRRLYGDCQLVSWVTTVDEQRAPVRERLEQALGPDLTRLLITGLAAEPV